MSMKFIHPEKKPATEIARLFSSIKSLLVKQAYLLAFLLMIGCNPSTPEPIWVGHLTSSDKARADGEEASRAIQLVLTRLREKEEMFGGRPLGVRHVPVADPAQARAETVRLLAVNGVLGLLVGPGAPGADDAILSARAHGASVVVLDELLDLPAPAILVATDPLERARALASFTRKRLNKSRVALIADRKTKLASALADAFTARWHEEKGQIREWTEAKPEELKAYQPEAIIFAVLEGQMQDPANAVLKSGLGHVPLLLLDEKTEPALLAILGTAKITPAVYVASTYAPEVALAEEGQQWRAEFTKRFGHAPRRAALLARDGLELIIAGLREAGNDRAKLLEGLKGVKEFASLTGKITWDKGQPRRQLFILGLMNGKREVMPIGP